MKSNGVARTANAFAKAPAMVRDKFVDMIHNVTSSRERFFKQFFFDDRKDIYEECGWPKAIMIDHYKNMYDRSGVASRVVDLFPSECWQMPPHIYEDEDPERTTVFEQAIEDLDKDLSGSSWHKAVEGENSALFEVLKRGDELSGIGSFGVLLIGFNDNKPLSEPVEGIDEFGRATNLKEDVETQYVDDDGNVVSEEELEKIEAEEKQLEKEEKFEEKQAEDELKSEMFEEEQKGKAEILKKQGRSDEAEMIEKETEVKKSQEDKKRAFEQDRIKKPTDNELPSFNELSEELGQLYSMGTDAQYSDPFPYTDQGEQPEQEEGDGMQLLYIKAFDESLVQILEYESNPSNPRYGLPTRYRITLNDPQHAASHGGVGLDTTAPDVHWTRVIHLADTKESSDTFATPRMQVVFNNLLNHQKVSGGSAEMYWKAAFMGLSFETHPQMGGDVDVPVDELKDQMEQYMNGLQRYFWSAGMSVNSLAPQVSDPTPQIDNQIKEICIKLGCPKRIFEGSERGELSSSQDEKVWNKRVLARCKNYISSRIIAPLIDRLIATGVLPQPKQYSIDWPDRAVLSDKEMAEIGNQQITAMSQYVKGEVESIMTAEDMFTEVLGFSDDKAKAFAEHVKEAEPLDVSMPGGMMPGMMPPGPGMGGQPPLGLPGPDDGAQGPESDNGKASLPFQKNESVENADCGAGVEGSPGFQLGNTCGSLKGQGFGEFVDDYRSLLSRVRDPEGGFTYHPVTGNEPDKGYVVSIFEDRSFAKPIEDITEDDMLDYVQSNADLLKGDNNYLGGWVEEGRSFLDVAVVLSDKKKAMQLGRDHDQIGIFDLENFKTIYINKKATSGGVANTKGQSDGRQSKTVPGESGGHGEYDFVLRENQREKGYGEGTQPYKGTDGGFPQESPTVNIIRKLPDGKYRLFSHSGKNLGTFDSREAAEKHEREVEFFKRQDNAECGAGVKGSPGFQPGNTCGTLSRKGPGSVDLSSYVVDLSKLETGFEGKMVNPNAPDTFEAYRDADGNWTKERQALHNEIIESHFEGKTPVENPQSFMTGGGTASGKSSAMKISNINVPENTVEVDSDGVKAKLPEYNAIKSDERIWKSAAATVHEESSYLSKEIMNRAVDEKYNVVLDGTGNSTVDKLEKKINQLSKGGREVKAIYVSADTGEALKRAHRRAERTGRYVPDTFVRHIHKSVSTVFPKAVNRDLFGEVELYDSNQRPARKIVSKKKGGKLNVHNQELWTRFLAKARE